MPAYKYKATGYILALLVGGIGAHHFYYRNYVRGTLYLLFCWTFIPIILGWVDMFFIAKWNDKINLRINEVMRSSQKSTIRKPSVLTNATLSVADKPENSTLSSEEQIHKLSQEYSLPIGHDIILSKYAHLTTPKYIEDNVRALVKPTKEKNQTGFIITYSNSQQDFAKDSYKYRNKKHSNVPEIPLKEYWTTFSKLNERQLKWYFYWREQVLKGNYLDVDLSYLILFTYELINYTFHQKAAFNVSMLVKLHDNYIERIPKVANYLPEWIADMLMELSEEELAKEWRNEVETLPSLYSQLIEKKEILEKISIPTWRPYFRNLRETVFFSNNKSKIYKTFKESIPLLKSYHEEQGNSLEDVWFERAEQRNVRPLFRSAVLARDVDDVHIYTTTYVPTEMLYNEITALFKMAENVTRLLNGEKREIKVESGILPDDFQQRIVERLEKAKRTNKRFTVVQEVGSVQGGSGIPQPDIGNESAEELDDLNRFAAIQFNDEIIEEKANENKALQEEFLTFFESHSFNNDVSQSTESTLKQNALERAEDSSISVADNSSEVILLPKEEIALFKQHQFLESIEVGEGDLNEFIESLTTIEMEFLSRFENEQFNGEEAKMFLKQRGQMLGMVLSTMNEKANEFLGDNLLEEMSERIILYEEFGKVTLLAKERAILEN
ncbi:TerB N-terminal domain-containing protein [Sporosarcina sp. Sa2YVA2]|uniref:TerB N-terminal domain-containing protein n=1 Tax=Sporosarcina quadrami TaxID=2762234 RepID=A0ABR8UD34_9BACL|nr:TerB N-terminal domain-containing protein [Sporosarcina quadrami]MBD7985955.1 TerB N-terminal domain-containing protein [Sporosarcina quadrami]